MDYRFAYLLIDILLFPFWIVLFNNRQDLRHKMILLSLLIGATATIGEFWYQRDYWRPETILGWPTGIEAFLFGFLMGGIGSVIYEEIFGRRFSKRHIRKHNWSLVMTVLVGLSVIVANVLFLHLGINSIYSSIAAFIFLGGLMVLYRRDMWIDAMVSGLFCSFLLLVIYIVLLYIYPELFIRMWFLENLSGITFVKVPIEELAWTFGLGFIVGPIYEFYSGLTLKSRR